MAWAGSGLLLTTALEALPDPLCLIRLQLTSSTSPRPQSSLRCQEATPPWKCPSHSTHTQPLLQLWPFFYQPCPHPPSHHLPIPPPSSIRPRIHPFVQVFDSLLCTRHRVKVPRTRVTNAAALTLS